MVDPNEEQCINNIMNTLEQVNNDGEQITRPKISFGQLMRIRWVTIKQCLTSSIVSKFYLFLLLQGFMPDFQDYSYFFATEMMGITLF